MFNPSRDEARRFLIDAWRKRRDGRAAVRRSSRSRPGSSRCTPSTTRSSKRPSANLDRDWHPESGRRQSVPAPVAAPRGRRAACRSTSRRAFARSTSGFVSRSGDEHPAQHAVLECLGEVLWNAQRHGTAPDAALYLACLDAAALGAGRRARSVPRRDASRAATRSTRRDCRCPASTAACAKPAMIGFLRWPDL